MRRICGIRVALLCVAFLLPFLSVSSVSADSLGEFILKDGSKRFLPSALPFGSRLAARSSSREFSDGFALPLKADRLSKFQLIERRTLQIPVVDSAQQLSGSVEVLVDRVSDFEGIEGALVHKANQPSFGVHGSFLDVSSEEQRSWTLQPEAAAEGAMPFHRVQEGQASDEHAHREPLALLEQLKQQVAAERPLTRDSPASTARTALALEDVIREVQLVVVSSGDFSGSRSNDQLVAEVAATVAAADTFFDVLRLRIALVGVQIFRPGAGDPFASATANRDGLEMLEAVRDLWQQRAVPEHDVTAVFARSSFTGVFGLAYPETSCVLPQFSYLFATQSGAGSQGLAGTLAHELGHIIGMTHDEGLPEGVPSLMWPFFVSSPGGFSDFSIKQYEAHIDAGGSACFSVVASLVPEPEEPSSGGPGISGFGFADGLEARIANL